MQTQALQLEGDSRGQRSRPLPDIVVAAHCGDRRQLAQLREHLGGTNVAGMDEMLRARQRLQGLRAQQAMRVRNHTDPKHGMQLRARSASAALVV